MRGLRVLDLSTTLAGAYSTRLLATAGSDVVIVEPPGGSPLRLAPPWLDPPGTLGPTSAAWEYLQANKRGIVADPGSESLLQLAADMDLVVLSVDGDLAAVRARADLLRAVKESLVVVVISSFGLTGRYSGYRSSAVVDWAMGGHLYLTGEPHREPLAGGGPWSSYLAGATATIAAQAGVIRARRTGRGDVVDVGRMESAVASHQWSIVLYSHQGVVKGRFGNRHGEAHHPLAIYRCADGWVVIGAVSAHQWEGLCIAMDCVELLADESLFAPAARFDRADELDVLIEAWTSRLPAAAVVDLLQESRCPAARVLALSETLQDPQLQARAYWAAPKNFGPSARMPEAAFTIGAPVSYEPAPTLGQHQSEVLS